MAKDITKTLADKTFQLLADRARVQMLDIGRKILKDNEEKVIDAYLDKYKTIFTAMGLEFNKENMLAFAVGSAHLKNSMKNMLPMKVIEEAMNTTVYTDYMILAYLTDKEK